MPKNQHLPRRLISPNNPVRRRLFPDHDSDSARKENFTNTFNESFAQETLEKSLKWNYDFKNDKPLDNPSGTVEWSVFEGQHDINMIGKIKTPLTEVDVQEVNVQEENETTPRVRDEMKRATVPRKRRSESDICEDDKGTRRKISFD